MAHYPFHRFLHSGRCAIVAENCIAGLLHQYEYSGSNFDWITRKDTYDKHFNLRNSNPSIGFLVAHFQNAHKNKKRVHPSFDKFSKVGATD